MARFPKCMSCKQFNIEKMSCEFHNKGIPKDIMNETKTCDKYNQKKVETDNDLPVASGR